MSVNPLRFTAGTTRKGQDAILDTETGISYLCVSNEARAIAAEANRDTANALELRDEIDRWNGTHDPEGFTPYDGQPSPLTPGQDALRRFLFGEPSSEPSRVVLIGSPDSISAPFRDIFQKQPRQDLVGLSVYEESDEERRAAEDATMCPTCWGIIPPEGVTMVPEDGELCHCNDATEPKTLTLTITREVQVSEVEDMLAGTGMLSYPWWMNVEDVKDAAGRLAGFKIKHWNPEFEDDDEALTTTVTLQQVVDAAARVIRGDGAKIDDTSAHDMAQDTLGYADANAADVTFQLAVYGKVVYG